MAFSLLILVIAFLSLIILMIIHEFGHFIIAKKFGIRVDEFGIGYPPRLFGKKVGDTIYSVNLIPLGAFVRIYGEEGGIDDYRSFANLKIWQRALIVVGGVAAFWLVAIVIFSIVFAIGAYLPVSDNDVQGLTSPEVKVIEVSQGSPAGLAGFKIADTITDVKIGGTDTKINKVIDFQTITRENAGKEITIVVSRNGKSLSFNLTPRIAPPAGQGSVGVGLERMATLITKYPWYLAPVQGAAYTWKTTINAVAGLYKTVSDLVSQRKLPAGSDFAGPLGITVFLANAASYGVGFFLYFIGVISVLVAIFNLFPIPALDGGKLIFLLIEKVRGKPISVKVEQRVTMAFFVILIALSLFITIRFDIPRFSNFLRSALQR